jgi:hypothetical protein
LGVWYSQNELVLVYVCVHKCVYICTTMTQLGLYRVYACRAVWLCRVPCAMCCAVRMCRQYYMLATCTIEFAVKLITDRGHIAPHGRQVPSLSLSLSLSLSHSVCVTDVCYILSAHTIKCILLYKLPPFSLVVTSHYCKIIDRVG